MNSALVRPLPYGGCIPIPVQTGWERESVSCLTIEEPVLACFVIVDHPFRDRAEARFWPPGGRRRRRGKWNVCLRASHHLVAKLHPARVLGEAGDLQQAQLGQPG